MKEHQGLESIKQQAVPCLQLLLVLVKLLKTQWDQITCRILNTSFFCPFEAAWIFRLMFSYHLFFPVFEKNKVVQVRPVSGWTERITLNTLTEQRGSSDSAEFQVILTSNVKLVDMTSLETHSSLLSSPGFNCSLCSQVPSSLFWPMNL